MAAPTPKKLPLKTFLATQRPKTSARQPHYATAQTQLRPQSCVFPTSYGPTLGYFDFAIFAGLLVVQRCNLNLWLAEFKLAKFMTISGQTEATFATLCHLDD